MSKTYSATCRRLATCFAARLVAELADNPFVGDIRGSGLFVGIELVADRDTNAPADPALATTLKKAAMEEGLMIYPGSGNVDGTSGAHILLAPPYIYAESNVSELVDKLGRAFSKTGLN